ncbi:segregation and condensation protein B [Chiayiivirga flava]|uniref:Segregation and condensation protein B n=1 Tax=Chiayiivirga flava TaxID=659595 RepID=A0A7W8D8Z3_9GAMM|nr:SMC-Scp complex subunit ScpB [Chiayiivirga flava]MBB5208338.1 segregation and condensation protein B [Chiayiivirga flava]
MDQPLIERIVEGAILASTQPLTLAQLYGLFPDDQPAPAGSIEQAIEALKAACDGRGVELVEVASGFRYQVQADVHAWIARLWTERPTRYTRATLETLALIAYRQPITRGEIEQIRGVAVNSNIIKMLEEREWIRVIGHRDVPGKPALFGTTKAFLDYFNLKSLDQLPPLAELNDIPDLEPQLDFEGPRPIRGIAAPEAGDTTPDDAPDGDIDASEAEDDRVEGEDGLADAPDADSATVAEGIDDMPLPESIPATAALDADADPLPSPGDAADESTEGADDDSAPERTA